MAFKQEMFSVTIIALLLASTLTVAFNVRQVGTSETIHANADGLTDLPTAKQEVSILSEAPPIEWSRSYGVGSIRDLVETADGGYALAGHTSFYGAGNIDFWLVKTDSAGNALWNRTYGGSSVDSASALIQTSDGGYAVAGFTVSFGAGNGDFWLVKTDANGDAQWNKTYGGTGSEHAYALIQMPDDGYLLAGRTDSFGASSSDSWLVKTDSEGYMQWNMTYGGTGEDYTIALVETADGGYALAGSSGSYCGGSGGIHDFWLIKTDANGNVLWNTTYGGVDDDDFASVLVQTVDGGYALAGCTDRYVMNNIWLVKTDSAGNALWNKTYGGIQSEQARGLVETVDGGYALLGGTSSYGAGGDDWWLIKTDAVGNALWNMTYGGTGEDVPSDLIETVEGDYLIAGSAFGYCELVKLSYGSSIVPATSVTCPRIALPGSSVTCIAFVSGSNLTGNVTWSTNSSGGSFSQPVSNLSSGSCSTTYTDTELGTATITATYSGDSNNPPSSCSALLTVLADGSIFQGDLVVPSGANCTIINQRLDVNGSVKIESGGTLYLENASLNIIDYRVGWNWRRNKISVYGEVECIDSTIDTNRLTSIRGDGSVRVSNSLLNKTYVYLENEYSVLDVVSSDITSLVFTDGPTTIANSTIEFVGGRDVRISDSEIQTLDCVPGAGVTVQSSNVSELRFAITGDGSFNISDLKPGFLDSWNSLQNSNFSTNIPNLPNTVISNSYIHNWSFLGFESGTSGIDVFINNSDLYLVELLPATSPSPIDLPIGSLVANGSVMNLIYLQITTYGPYNITLDGLSPGFFDSWNSMQSPCISMNWWNSTTREGCLLPNITLENTRVENWSPYWGGGGGSSPQVCPSNWTLHDCNLYWFWAQAQQADNLCISSSLIGELTLDGWWPPDNPTKNTTISECAIGSFFAQYSSNTLASDCTIENMLAYGGSVTCLHNCSVTSLKAYDNATVNVVDSPSTIKEMLAYDSSKTQVLNSTVSELSAFGSATVREITYEPKDSRYTIGERNAAGYPSFQSDSASNVSRTFTFEVQSKTGAPQSGMNLSLYKTDGTLIQSTYTNLSGQASLKVTWGAQTQTTFGDCFTIRAQNETWQTVAQITPGSATFQTLVLHSPYDVGITEILSMKTVVGQGYDLPISITVMNYGAYNESFNATVYANATIIGEAQVSLNPAEETTMTFKWNTTGLAYGNYSIWAYARPVEGETETGDNTLVDGLILVTIPGDINDDQYVNAKDAVLLGSAFYPAGMYNPNVDINGDGYVNAKDAIILGTHFGQNWS